MATQYPTTLDTAVQQPSPLATTEMDDAGFLHDEVHTSHSGAIIAIETKLGVGATTAATASTNHVLVKQGDGDTEWAAVPAAVPTTITVADTTDTTCSVALFESATGDLAPKSDAGATYNAATGVLTATGFSGPLTGAVTGNASTATNSTTVTVADTSDTTCSVALFESATGSLAAKTDAGATYNAGTGVLTATGFAGPLTGNVTGDASGSSGSCTGNAATATNSGTVTVADTTDTTCSVALFESATGSLAAKTDAGATYNAGTGTLTATAFAGPLTGNVTGNASGTAATVTGAAQTNITSVGTLSALAVTGAITAGSVVAPLVVVNEDNTHSFNAADAGKTFTYSGSSGATTLTLPQDSATTFAIGTQIVWVRLHTSNAVTFAQGTGATIISKEGTGPAIDGQYAVAVTVKQAANTWLIFGALA